MSTAEAPEGRTLAHLNPDKTFGEADVVAHFNLYLAAVRDLPLETQRQGAWRVVCEMFAAVSRALRTPDGIIPDVDEEGGSGSVNPSIRQSVDYME